MAFKIVPYLAEHETQVAQFNQRLKAAGVRSAFPKSSIPEWLPQAGGREIYQEFFLCFDGDLVRGGYILKHQLFEIQGEVVSIGNFQLPLSEGVIDRKFGMIGVTLLRDALKREPVMFCQGLGGYDVALSKLLKASGWQLASVPFYFRVINPGRFLRGTRFLRSSAVRRAVLDIASYTGMGWLGIKAAQALHKGAIDHGNNFQVEEVPEFDDWADSVWSLCRREHYLQAVRDKETLKILYPKHDSRFHRLVIFDDKKAIGWCVYMVTQMSDHKHFGGLCVGTLVDLLCTPEAASRLMREAEGQIGEKGADLIVSNQSSAAYGRGLKSCGFLSGPSNFILAVSPELAKKVSPFETNLSKFHFNRGDGDGPIHL